jgi:hypothetical protein
MLWSLRTAPNRSTGLTPRVEAYEEEDAEKSRQLSVDLLEEERDLAAQ